MTTKVKCTKFNNVTNKNTTMEYDTHHEMIAAIAKDSSYPVEFIAEEIESTGSFDSDSSTYTPDESDEEDSDGTS